MKVDGCDSLKSPPAKVCEQGVEAIRQYFRDIAKGKSKSIPAATIAVIGQKMAGKTSLVKTLQNKEKKRVLSTRRPDLGIDDATRVFNIEEVATDDMMLRFIDVGGHEVYHVTYPLTLRDSCIAAIVVNTQEYHKLSLEKNIGPSEAVRRVCFDSLSQIYISNPSLGAPLLILTHKDQFTEDDYKKTRNQFLTTCEAVKKRLLRDYDAKNPAFTGHLNCKDKPLFDPSDIFDIGGKSGSYDVFELILQALGRRCEKFIRVVPTIWELIGEILASTRGPYIMYAQLLQRLSQDHGVDDLQLSVILRYHHDSGKILWYPEIIELKPYIFHSIDEITKLLSVLFAHDDETKWKDRLANEQTFMRSDEIIVENEEFEAMYIKFKESGIMNADLLLYLIQSESSFARMQDRAPALAILKEFRLLYETANYKGSPSFFSPYFPVGYQGENLMVVQKPVRIRAEMFFKGLALPRYAYGQMGVGVLNQVPNGPIDNITLAKNGLTIEQGEQNVRFTHDFKSRKLSLEIAVEVKHINKGWNEMRKLLAAIKFHTQTSWPAARFVTSITCAHCLLKAYAHPRKDINPDWLKEQHMTNNPVNSVTCQGDKVVPACLKIPCKYHSSQP